MRRPLAPPWKFLAAPFGVFLSLVTLSAQEDAPPTFWQPEIRRAVPVGESTPAPQAVPTPASPAPVVEEDYDQPEWMQRLPQARPATPVPASTPPPVADEENVPYRPRGTVEVLPAREVPTAPAEDPGSIRLRPQDGVRDEARELLDTANSIYSRKMYEFAALEYEKFLSTYPRAQGRDIALFRLGECHRIEGKTDAARRAYERLVREFREGGFFGAGAYRLGEILFAESRYDEARVQFENAASQATEQEVRLSARYQVARCLSRLGKAEEAARIYREVVAVETNNPYREHARLALAESLAASGDREAALDAYSQIAAGRNPSTLRAEAAVKAGALAAEMGDAARASKFFTEALALRDSGPWRAVAVLGSIRLHSTTADYKRVASMSTADLDLLSGEARAEALSLVAAANKELGSNLKAREFYDQLTREFPRSPFALKGRFQKIVALYELRDQSARSEIEAYLKDALDPADRDRATLLLAEILFTSNEFADAATRYETILNSTTLADDLKRQARYKRAWSLAKADQHSAAADAYTEFLRLYPDAPNAAGAIVQRGLSRQQLKAYQAALEDFSEVIEKHPGSPEREFALQQQALVHGQLEDYPSMKASFRRLLEEFPDTAGAAQAEFWIGWASFEAKDYADAIPHLERARTLDGKTYGDRAALRLLLAHYYLENRDALMAEASKAKPENIPREVLRWLGIRSAQAGDFASSVKYFTILADSGAADPESLILLAESQNALGHNREAITTAEAYLGVVGDAPSRARAMLAIAEAHRVLGEFDQATKSAEEALALQPEGRINATARLTVAEIEFSRSNYDAAARAFMTVALLYDDPAVTPRALHRASESYRRLNLTAEADKAAAELRERFPDYVVPGESSAAIR